MKIKQVAASVVGDDVIVYIGVGFMKDDVFEMTDAVTTAFLDAATRGVHMAGEIVADNEGSRNTEEETCADTASSAETNKTQPSASSSDARSTRRARSAAASPASPPADAPSGPTTASASDGSPRRRRSSSSSEPSQPLKPTPEELASAPPLAETTGRRRRGSTTTDAASNAPSSPTSTEEPTRRRRGTSAPAAPISDKITDSDLMKACSAAVEKLSPAPVKELIKKFGFSTVNEIPEGSRRTFLEALAKRVAEGG